MSDTRIGALLAQLENAAQRKRLTKKDLAGMTGLHPNTLRYFRGFRARLGPTDPAWTPSVETVARLEPVLLKRKPDRHVAAPSAVPSVSP